jgi:acyl carrier protein
VNWLEAAWQVFRLIAAREDHDAAQSTRVPICGDRRQIHPDEKEHARRRISKNSWLLDGEWHVRLSRTFDEISVLHQYCGGMKMPLDDRIITIFTRLFRIDKKYVTPQLSYKDVPAWDSLGQLTLIMEIERDFGVRFDTNQILTLDNVAKIQEALRAQATE